MLISHFQVTFGFDSICIVVAPRVNLRQKSYNINMNFSYQNTMFEKEISIHKEIVSHEIGKVTYHNYFFSKYGKYLCFYQKYVLF